MASKVDLKQFGGLRGKSTTHELINLVHHWHTALDNSHYVRGLFVNYTIAFDHLDHIKLLDKLAALEVPGCLIVWLRSFLTQGCQCVVIKNVVSEWLTLRGGSWLGPLVFILFINDLSVSC